MASTPIAENIVALREAHGWTRAEFQRRLEKVGLNVHLTTLRRVEIGEQEPKLTDATHYAAALGVTVDDLLRDPQEASLIRDININLAKYRSRLERFATAYESLREAAGDLADAIEAGVRGRVSEEMMEEALDLLRSTANPQAMFKDVSDKALLIDEVERTVSYIETRLNYRKNNG